MFSWTRFFDRGYLTVVFLPLLAAGRTPGPKQAQAAGDRGLAAVPPHMSPLAPLQFSSVCSVRAARNPAPRQDSAVFT